MVIVALYNTKWHTHTQTRSEGLLCTRDRPVAETSTWQQQGSQGTDSHLSKQGATDPRLRPRDYQDRLSVVYEVNDALKTSDVVDAHSRKSELWG